MVINNSRKAGSAGLAVGSIERKEEIWQIISVRIVWAWKSSAQFEIVQNPRLNFRQRRIHRIWKQD